MSATNLVTSRYLTELRAAALETRPKKQGEPRECPSSGSTRATVATPTGAAVGPPTPSSEGGRSTRSRAGSTQPDESATASERGRRTPGSVSRSPGITGASPSPVMKLGLEVCLDRFRDIGIARRQAHCPQDVLFCWKMCALMGLEENVPDVFIIMLFRSTKLLHRCGYHSQDIVTLGSHAVVYAVDVMAQHLGTMDWTEAANMVGLQFFLAQTYLMDEQCPLGTWHKHIFQQYCSLQVLCTAVMQLLRSRNYILRLPETGLSRIHAELLTAVHNYRWNPSLIDTGARYPR